MATRAAIIGAMGDTLDGVVDATQEIGGGYISTRLQARIAALETAYPNHLTDATQAGQYLGGAQVAMGSAITEVFEANDWRTAFLGAIADGILLQSDAFDPHPAVRAATTANITLSGLQTIDGISLVDGNRAGVKNQSTPSQNGIYIVHSGAWTRAADMDATGELLHNSFYVVLEGTINGGSSWICSTSGTITLGTTATTWELYQSALNITAGDGLIRDVNTIHVGAGTGIQVNADSVQISPTYSGQTSITTVGTIGAGDWQGSAVAAGYGGTGQTTFVLGDILFASAPTTLSRLAGNTSAARNFLRQTGTGTISAAPTWDTLIDSDIPVTLTRTSRAISTTGPLAGGGDLSADRTISITGLSGIGSANQIPGANTSGTAWEYKTFAGTSGRVTVAAAAGSITWDISSTYIGQGSITTLGTIGTGVWQGTPVGIAYGGTGLSTFVLGDMLYASSATTLARLAGNATTTSMFLRQVGSGSGSAAPTWAVISSADLPGGFSGFDIPSGTIGLTAVAGTATTGTRSDGTPALSQAIAPTWTALHSFNPGTSQADVLMFAMAQPSSAGQRDSHIFVMRGTAFDTAGHNADWRSFVDVTSNGAASSLRWQSRIDAGGFTDRIVISDGGVISVATWQGATVAPTFGGTGLSAYTVGDMLYSSATNTLARLAGNVTSARNFLRQTGTGTASTAPAWDTVQDTDLPATIVRTSRSIATTAPLSGGGDLSANRTLTITGLSTIGAANQLPGTNAAASAWEYKTLAGTANRLTVTHAAGSITWDISSSYAGQGTITTVGTIGAGLWRGTPVEATAGGTGLTAYAVGDLIYSSATNTLSRLAGNATTARLYLSQTGTGSSATAPVWGAIPAGDLPGAFSGFANPTVQIGLTMVPGTATTAMRSDAAPALSQSIAPVWVGLHSWNSGATPTNAILVDMAQPGVAGQRDSHWIQVRGTAFDTSGHNADWRYFADVTSNGGASTFRLQSRIDAATFTDRLTITDAGAMTVPQKFLVAFDSGVTNGEHFVGYFTRDVAESTADLLLGYRANGTIVTHNLIRSGNSLPLIFGTSTSNLAMILSDAGNLNFNGAVDTAGYRVNIKSGGLALDNGNSIALFGPGGDPSTTNQEFMQMRYTAAQGGQIYVSRNAGGGFRDLTLFTSDIERIRLTASGNLNFNGAGDATNFKLNVNSGYVSVNNSFSFTAFGVGTPSDFAAGGNTEHVSLYHDGAGLGASIDVTKTGSSGVIRPFAVRMGGTAMLTVDAIGTIHFNHYGNTTGPIPYIFDATGLLNTTANFRYNNFGLILGGDGATLQFGNATTDTGPFNINVLGSGGATPATKGTGFGRNLIITAGASDNTAGKAGGDLYLRGGAPTSPSTVFGDVILADAGGSVKLPSFAGIGNRLVTFDSTGTLTNGTTISGLYTFPNTVEVTGQLRAGNGFSGSFSAHLWLSTNSGTDGPLIGCTEASNDGNGALFLARKARGTIAAPLPVQVSDAILNLISTPYYNGVYQNGPGITYYVEATGSTVASCGIVMRIVDSNGSAVTALTLGADKSARMNGSITIDAAVITLSLTAGNMTQDVRGISRIKLTGSNGGTPTLNMTNARDGQLMWIFNNTTTGISILNTINGPTPLDAFEIAFLQNNGNDGWMVFKATV